MAWYRCGGGGNGGAKKTAKLVLEAYSVGTDQDNTFPRTQWDRNARDSSYFSFSSNRWIAQKDFTALIILVHYQYRTASNSSSYSKATVNRYLTNGSTNFDAIALCPYSPDRFEGSYGVEYGFIKIKSGDKVLEGKDIGLGYVAPYFYILETEDDMPTTTLANGDNVSFTTDTVGYSILQDYFDFA